ncbi:MAG: DUF2059 domain-containing protein [Pseudomonadota bacterium]|nr:DUF2059 domain-containing protein [Pseudomonadota bacterium]
MKRLSAACVGTACVLGLLGAPAAAQNNAKKELVQKILAYQQAEIESLARGMVERPAAQMMQEAGLAMQRQVAPDKREAVGRAIETEVKKYVEEAYPLVRERAIRAAPPTIGVTLEEKMSEDELKQLVVWLDSPVNKKYQQLGPEMRNAFIQKLVADAGPLVDPKVMALSARIRVILGLPPAAAAASVPAPPSTVPPGGAAARPAARAASK